MNSLKKLFLAAGLAAVAGSAYADEVTVDIHAIDSNGVGAKLGTVKAEDSQYGLLLTPNIAGLTPGPHGFHVHEMADCGPREKDGEKVAGLAAGGHFDPQKTGAHKGPYDDSGHLGDLPVLYVVENGTATILILAPRLKVADIKAHSLMIHAGGDNYSDEPLPLGGGGARVACGVID